MIDDLLTDPYNITYASDYMDDLLSHPYDSNYHNNIWSTY